jgi:hypothetical protein
MIHSGSYSGFWQNNIEDFMRVFSGSYQDRNQIFVLGS